MNKGGHILNIQVLRGIAALMVCCFHFRYLLESEIGDFIFRNGWIGVQLFFVISGFIMVYTTNKVKGNGFKYPINFIVKRIIRIVPLYFIATILYMVLIKPDAEFIYGNASKIIKGLLFQPQLTSTEGPAFGYPLLHVGWSLNYEMLFYFIFFIGLLLKDKIRYGFIIITISALGIMMPALLNGQFIVDYNAYVDYVFPYLNFLFNPILTLFITGVLIGLTYHKFSISKNSLIFFQILSISSFILYELQIINIEFNSLTDSLFCGLMVLCLVIKPKNSTVTHKKENFWVLLGNSSYSIYLLHPIIIIVVKYIFHYLDIQSNILIFIVGLISVVLLSIISYRMIELNMTKKLKTLLLPNG
jgi:peptidoglycan/LPS O-acetylase OafA/YrhL